MITVLQFPAGEVQVPAQPRPGLAHPFPLPSAAVPSRHSLRAAQLEMAPPATNRSARLNSLSQSDGGALFPPGEPSRGPPANHRRARQLVGGLPCQQEKPLGRGALAAGFWRSHGAVRAPCGACGTHGTR